MKFRLLSDDRPGHPMATLLVVLLFLALATAPFAFPGTRSVAVASRICVFIVLAASYDMLLGYTGIVSFAHTMFFAFGAYGVAIPLARGWVGGGAILLGGAAGVILAAMVAALIALLSLRVQKIFFSMITLAVASFAQILATQLRDLTGGEDGLTFSLPAILGPSFRLLREPVLGVRIDGRLITYYLVFAIALALFLFMLRVVNSPFGRVLQAISRKRVPRRGARLPRHGVSHAGQRPVGFDRGRRRRPARPAAALCRPGCHLVLFDHGRHPADGGDRRHGHAVRPGVGSGDDRAGAILSPARLAERGRRHRGLPLLPALFHPARWLLWLGTLFILIVYFFPAGVVGTLRPPREMSRAVIIDCDPGTDDAIALFQAFASSELDVRLVTVAGGNVGLDRTLPNACALVGLAGATAPVVAGADRPLVGSFRSASYVHGADGIGGVLLPPGVTPTPGIAADAIRAVLRAAGPAEITLVGIGPATNLALALATESALIDRIAEIVLMTGAWAEGNVTPAAEFNAWSDPEALAIVLAAGCPITLATLELTSQAIATPERLATLRARPGGACLSRLSTS